MLKSETVLQQRYRIVRQLGQGGMGAVYEALDARLHRTVALKETLVESNDLRRAFAREAHLLANLSHPALPKVIDHFSEGDGEYLVMDHIAGADLSQQLAARGEPFPTATVLRWADELLDALEYLHGNEPPIIHRDIKPSNLKLTPKGHVVLLDFGLAKGTAGQMTRVQASQSVLGYTPNYAALEQIQGERTGPRSDLYSLAATLYHLLTTKSPVDALKRATEVLHDEPDPLRPVDELNPQVSRAVANVLMRALALRPSQRPESAAELRAELQHALAAGPADATLAAYQTTIVNEPARSTVAPAAATDALTPQALERETMLLTKPPVAAPSASHDAAPPPQTNAQASETLTVVAPRTTTRRRPWPLLAVGAALCALVLAGVLFAVRPWQHTQTGDTTPAVNPAAQPAAAPSAAAQANVAPANTAQPNPAQPANTVQPSPSVANARTKAEQPKPDENSNAARARDQRAAEQQSEAAQAAAEQQRAQQEAAQAAQAATAELQRELASAQDDAKRALADAINAQASVQQARTAAAAAERELQRVEAQRASGQVDQAALRDARQRNAEARVAFAMAQAHAREQRQAAQAANMRVQRITQALANTQTHNAPHK